MISLPNLLPVAFLLIPLGSVPMSNENCGILKTSSWCHRGDLHTPGRWWAFPVRLTRASQMSQDTQCRRSQTNPSHLDQQESWGQELWAQPNYRETIGVAGWTEKSNRSTTGLANANPSLVTGGMLVGLGTERASDKYTKLSEKLRC